jgi:high-affinity Fe2+/Pb2+ permease
MRKMITALSFAAVAAAAVAMPTFASAQENQFNTGYAAPIAGAAVGTAVGVGLYNGWYGSSGAFVSGATTTVGGAITAGGVAGVGTVALIDAAFQPCRGFHALFGANKEACANGEYVGDRPARSYRRVR